MTPGRPLNEFFSGPRASELLSRYDSAAPPSHVAVIMDGNGRWAQGRGLPRIAGHKAGASAVRELIEAALALGIDYLTIYSFSSENWRRPEDEVRGLMDLFVEVLERELNNLQAMKVRLKVIGRMSDVPRKTREAFQRCTDATAGNTGLTFVVALNYGGRQELADAAASIAREVAEGRLDAASVDEDTVGAHLYTTGIPDPDLVVRTSGEMRVSNFLLWQIAYAELYVTDTLWPDFSRDDLLAALVDYQARERRFGGTK